MGEPAVIGEIVIFGGDYPPRDWAFCQGQLLQIVQYSALFAVIGTRYGGDGITNFALPDLRGRTPLGAGLGPGLLPCEIAGKKGFERVSLGINELPAHSHIAHTSATGNLAADFNCVPTEGVSSNPSSGYLAGHAGAFKNSGTMATMHSSAVALNQDTLTVSTTSDNTGGNALHENMHPFLVLNYIIALEGIFPQRP